MVVTPTYHMKSNSTVVVSTVVSIISPFTVPPTYTHVTACSIVRVSSTVATIDDDDRAHGRLGTGDNRCRHAPVRLKSWPPGFPGCVVQAIALGGAHSVLLASRGVPTTLANPWGVESVAYAWGYGFGGQLGIGEQVCVCVCVMSDV